MEVCAAAAVLTRTSVRSLNSTSPKSRDHLPWSCMLSLVSMQLGQAKTTCLLIEIYLQTGIYKTTIEQMHVLFAQKCLAMMQSYDAVLC